MTWKNRERWQQLLSGSACPICEDAHLPENPFSYLIEEQEFSYFRLTKAQDPRGLCAVILKRHATELFLMEPRERDGYFRDLARAARAIQTVFAPIKIHYGIFGSICPHVHCHVMPKYVEDDPHGPVTFGNRSKVIAPEQAQDLLRRLRAALPDMA